MDPDSLKSAFSQQLLDSCNFFYGQFGLRPSLLKEASDARRAIKMLDEYDHIPDKDVEKRADGTTIDHSLQKKKSKEASSALVAYQGKTPVSEAKPWETGPRVELAIRAPERRKAQTWHAPWKLKRVLTSHQGWVRCLAVDPSNKFFASGGQDRLIKIWDLATGVVRTTFTGHLNAVRGLAISAKQPYMFSCGEDKQVKCWDLETNSVIRSYHGHLSGVYCMALHPEANVLFTGGRDGAVRTWDIRTKKEVMVLGGHAHTVQTVLARDAHGPGSKRGGSAVFELVSGSADKMVRLWDIRTGKTRQTLTHHKKGVRALAWAPPDEDRGVPGGFGLGLEGLEGDSFLSGAADNVKVWRETPGGETDVTFARDLNNGGGVINCLAARDDGVVAAGCDDGKLRFWDFASGENFQTYQSVTQPGSMESENGIFAMCFDYSQSRLITAECDKTIKIWCEDDMADELSHPIEEVDKSKRFKRA